MNIWKAALGAGAVAGLAEYAIAEYFFRRTMLRQNASVERTMNMAGTNWETYLPKIQKRKEWMLQQPHQDVSLTSKDGLKLHATYFPAQNRDCEEGSEKEQGQKLMICFHGYTGKGMSDYVGLSGYYLPKGYGLLLVDERAHGDSEGEYVGFGCLDRFDALQWIALGEKLAGENCQIWLHGISMGGATVLMTSGLKLPESVKGIVADCAFTSAKEVFSHVLKSQYHMWPDPILAISDRLCKKRTGYSLGQCNAAEEVKKAQVPILLIHGDADTFVPSRMCQEIYRNCKSKKDMLIVSGASHAESYYKDTEAYERKLTEFLEGTAV